MLQKIKKYFNAKIVKIYDNTKEHKNRNNKKHLTIFIISDFFIKKKLFNRHQQVYNLLSQEIKTKIYALSLHTYTINEWQILYKNNIKKINCHFST